MKLTADKALTPVEILALRKCLTRFRLRGFVPREVWLNLESRGLVRIVGPDKFLTRTGEILVGDWERKNRATTARAGQRGTLLAAAKLVTELGPESPCKPDIITYLLKLADELT